MSRYYDRGQRIAQSRIAKAQKHVARIERGEITASRAWGYIYRIIYGRALPYISDYDEDNNDMRAGFREEARDFVRAFIAKYYDQLSKRQQNELPNEWLPFMMRKTYYTPLIARLRPSSRVRIAYERGEMSYEDAVYAASIIIARHNFTDYDDHVNGDNRDELRDMLRAEIEKRAEQLRAREYEINKDKVMTPIPID
jgi:hypothetical protein